MFFTNRLVRVLAVLTVCATGTFSGCQREEKVLDIEAPGVDIEVKKTGDGPDIEVETRK